MLEEEIQNSISENDVRNTELLNDLSSKGVSVKNNYPIEHHFWAGGQLNAALFAKELYERGYLILVISPVESDDGSNWWNVEAEIKRTIADAASHQVTEELVRLAAQFDSVYDGWGTSL